MKLSLQPVAGHISLLSWLVFREDECRCFITLCAVLRHMLSQWRAASRCLHSTSVFPCCFKLLFTVIESLVPVLFIT